MKTRTAAAVAVLVTAACTRYVSGPPPPTTVAPTNTYTATSTTPPTTTPPIRPGRDNVRIHDLRHFAGTMSARCGNLVEVMNRLGHSTAKASLIYQQMVNCRDAELADALSKLAQ